MSDLEREFEEAKNLLISGQMDDCLTKFCCLLQKATEKYGETGFECAKFYYGYANALLYKQEASQDVFGVEMPNQITAEDYASDSEDHLGADEESEEDQQIQVKKSQEISQKESQNDEQNDEQNEEQNEEQSQQEDQGDAMSLIWENLETARFILDNHWKEVCQDEKVPQSDKVELLTLTAKVLKRLGDFLCISDEFSKAIQEYQRCLEIRQKVDDPNMSRELAELYFVVGSAVLMEDKNQCEAIAIKSFSRGKRILENNLEKHLNQKLDERYDKKILAVSCFDSEAIKELKAVVTDMWEKIEDTQLQLDQKAIVQKETNQMPQQSTGFDKPQLQNVQTVNIQRTPQVTRTITPQIVRTDNGHRQQEEQYMVDKKQKLE